MANERGAEVRVTANISDALRALGQLQQSMESGFSNIGRSIASVTNPIESVMGKLSALGAVLGGGAIFREAIAETTKFDQESIKVGRTLGVSATQASVWITAIEGVNATTDEFASAARGLTKNLRANEGDLNRMGLATRDASGNLRDMNSLMLDAFDVLDGYKEGTSRNIAAQTLFGKGMEASSNLMQLHRSDIKETEDFMRSLGAVVGQENVQAYREYNNATDKVKVAMRAVMTTVGNALMPVLTELAQWFAEVAPTAIFVFKMAIGGVATVFEVLMLSFRTMYETLKMGFRDLIAIGQGFGAVMYAVLHGDWEGAKMAAAGIGDAFKKNWTDALDSVSTHAAKTADNIANLFKDPTDAVKPSAAGNAAGPSRNPMDKLHEFNSAQDGKALADRKRLLAELEKAGEAYAADRKGKILEGIQIDQERDEALLRREQITQLQLLERLDAFNAKRLQAELEFIDKKIDIHKNDPDVNIGLLTQLEEQKAEIRRKYAEISRGIAAKTVDEQMKPIDGMVGSLKKGFTDLGTALLTNWRSVGSALRGIVSSIGQSIIQETIIKPLTARVAAWAKERLMTLAGIGGDAAKAGSGAAASQAGIPIVGPYLALAAMAAMLVAVGGMSAKVPSAAGGFDIPRGMNPLTQLHEREMVLPASLADTVRGMASPGGGGSGGNVTLNLQGVNMPGGYFMAHRSELVKALQKGIREARPGASLL